MGIQNLSSFVSNIEGLRNDHKLSDCFVVIDGYNLLFEINKKLNTEDNQFLFGGNYNEYRNQFLRFFKNLKKCNISPIMVFDGGLNPQFKESRKDPKMEENLEFSHEISVNPPQNDVPTDDENMNFPSLLKETMISVIKELMAKEEPKQIKSVAEYKWRVICFQTVLDSDLESAKLANDLKCPLISNDSDFLVMNIDEGVISCDSFEWETPLKSNNFKYYIECRIYKVIDFLDHFLLKPEMLPIFGSLMGNDILDYNIFDTFFINIHNELREIPWIKNQLKGPWHYNSKDRWLRMNQLLYYLSQRFFSASHAIDIIENYLIKERIDLKDFRNSIKSYQTNGNTFLKQLFDHKIKESEENEILIEEIVNEYRYPKWFLLDYFYRTELSPFVMTYVGLKLEDAKISLSLSPSRLENINFDSYKESSLILYASLFGLLRVERNDRTPVYVLMRRGLTLHMIGLLPTIHIYNKELPILSEIRNLSDVERKRLLFDIFRFKDKWMTDLEDNLLLLKFDKQDIDFWKYFLFVIKYWKLNTRVKHHFEFIRAIVYSLIYFRHNSLIGNDFNGLTSISKGVFKPFISHHFREFQAIYSNTNKLIALLGYPITDAKLHHCFNGVLFYNLMNEIIDGNITLWPFKEHRLNTITNFIIYAVSND